MARVSALLAELETSLQAIYPTIVFGFGEKDLARDDLGAPRIVWVPTNVKHGPSDKARTNPRRLLTRTPTIVAHCWAIDTSATAMPLTHYDALEDLVHNLLVAIYTSTWGSIDMNGEDWLQPQTLSLGHAALVTFAPQVPVEKIVYLTVQANQLGPEVRDVAPGDGNIDWSEP